MSTISERGQTPVHDRDDDQSDAPDLPSVSLGPHFEMHPVVFPAGALIVLSLVSLTFFVPSDRLESFFDGVKGWIGAHFGWLYVASLTGFLGFAVWLALGKYGRVRLGGDEEKPEFSRLTWFAMLFSAGMGIGLLFWSVAEPIYHFNAVPDGIAEGLAESRVAMAVTIFHWGLHPWALYAVVALALAYFGFRRGMPLGFRSLLYPILGERVWGPLGDAIDTLAIIATLTGVATSLGLGAMQVNAGLNFLFGVPVTGTMQVLIIGGITAVATVSVVLGLGTGIRRLSEANMGLAGLLMVLVIFGGGLVPFFAAMVENAGAYIQLLPYSSFHTGAADPEGAEWINSWTVFYWAWWISWSPFVGMFIARVSRGRTIREFITGVLLVPTAVGIVWLTAFGSTTLRQHVEHLVEEGDYAATVGEQSLESDTPLSNKGLPDAGGLTEGFQAEGTEGIPENGADSIAVGDEDPDQDLPEYNVRLETDNSVFAFAEESGLLVSILPGPSRDGTYERRGDGSLVSVPGGVPVRVEEVAPGAYRIVTESGDPHRPERTFDGTFKGETRRLTAVEYLGAPVLTRNGDEELRTLPTVLFALLEGTLPLGWLVNLAAGIATLCIILFFVTSSDSASMVIDIIASGGNPDPPVGTRLFWAVTEGLVAATLLVAGKEAGLGALQAASITAALPFIFILLASSVALVLALRRNETSKPPKPAAT